MQLRTLGVLAICLLLAPARASATSIGVFDWTYDAAFGTGSTFSVTNDSTDPFSDVFVDLYAPSESIAFLSLSLGEVSAGGTAQSIDDLSLLLVPNDLATAVLRLSFGSDPITATIVASSLQGDPAFLLQSSIDILTDDSPNPTPIPEPSTVVLVGSVLGAAAVRRVRSSRAARNHLVMRT